MFRNHNFIFTEIWFESVIKTSNYMLSLLLGKCSTFLCRNKKFDMCHMYFACWHVGRKFKSVILIWVFIMKYVLSRFDKQRYHNILYSCIKNNLLIRNFFYSDLDNQLTVTTYIWIWGFLKVTYLKKRTTYIIHKLNIPIRTLSRYEKNIEIGALLCFNQNPTKTVFEVVKT